MLSQLPKTLNIDTNRSAAERRTLTVCLALISGVVFACYTAHEVDKRMPHQLTDLLGQAVTECTKPNTSREGTAACTAQILNGALAERGHIFGVSGNTNELFAVIGGEGVTLNLERKIDCAPQRGCKKYTVFVPTTAQSMTASRL